MKYFRTFSITSFLAFAIFLNWNCGQESIEHINPINSSESDNESDGVGSISVRLVDYQMYDPCSGLCPANISQLLIDTTVNVYPWSIIYPSINTLDSIYVHPSCGDYCTVGWRVERYVTWSDINYNNFGYWQVHNDIAHKELIPVSGGSFSKINTITNLVCNSSYQVGVGVDHLSDERDKRNIDDLSLGLDFINSLKPRQYNWDRRDWYDNNISDGSKIDKKLTAGFIAQELNAAQVIQNAEWLNLVSMKNPQQLKISTENLLPVIIKAIQELTYENKQLRNKILHLQQITSDKEQLRSTKYY